jgi:hypothetical protein
MSGFGISCVEPIVSARIMLKACVITGGLLCHCISPQASGYVHDNADVSVCLSSRMDRSLIPFIATYWGLRGTSHLQVFHTVEPNNV